jgi:hypothetical protein
MNNARSRLRVCPDSRCRGFASNPVHIANRNSSVFRCWFGLAYPSRTPCHPWSIHNTPPFVNGQTENIHRRETNHHLFVVESAKDESKNIAKNLAFRG